MAGTNGTCTVGDCDRPIQARGLCTTHYSRARAGRDLERPSRKQVCLVEFRGCEGCGALFSVRTKRRARRFCSASCAQGLDLALRVPCEQCRSVFRSRLTPRGKRERFCSRACHGKWRSSQPSTVPVVVRLHFFHCAACGKLGHSKHPKARFCREHARFASPKVFPFGHKRVCRTCATPFQHLGTAKQHCSEMCERISLRKSQRICKARRKARIKGVAHERIDPIAVCDRDGWKCYICGRHTPMALRGTTDPRAPEVDHVHPISKGGAHLMTNVKCACRECNQLKSDRIAA